MIWHRSSIPEQGIESFGELPASEVRLMFNSPLQHMDMFADNAKSYNSLNLRDGK
jgi:hypothetical protein